MSSATLRRTTKQSVKRTVKPKQHLPHTPDYITIMPPGNVLAEKMFEMGIDSAELANRMKTPVETVRKLLRAEIALTPELAAKIENVTWMPANLLLRIENGYTEALERSKQHPEIPTCKREIPWT